MLTSTRSTTPAVEYATPSPAVRRTKSHAGGAWPETLCHGWPDTTSSTSTYTRVPIYRPSSPRERTTSRCAI